MTRRTPRKQCPQRSTLIQILDLYRVEEPRRGELLALLREVGQRGWMQQYRSELPEVYSDYIGFEDEARYLTACPRAVRLRPRRAREPEMPPPSGDGRP